jgi:alkylation response protein AidB-like acyl-CoA dehydrogenase
VLTEPITDGDTLEIRTVVRRFLAERLPVERVRELATTTAGHDHADWTDIASMGWPALAQPEELGGAGYGAPQFAVLCEELGRGLGVGPLLASSGFALPVLAACDDPVSRDLVAALAAGERVAALVDAPDGALAASAESVDGTAGPVLDAAEADVLVVVTGGEVLLVDRDAAGVTVAPAPCPDATRRVATVRFDDAGATRLAVGSTARLARARATADLNLAATQVGGAARALELTLEYLGTRHQFGTPIGSFQALKHRCADSAVTVSLARELVHDAAALADTGPVDDLVLAARGALVRAAAVSVDTTAGAIQLHGGIGFTEEHVVGLYYRRALADRDLRGPAVEHRAALVDSLGWS